MRHTTTQYRDQFWCLRPNMDAMVDASWCGRFRARETNIKSNHYIIVLCDILFLFWANDCHCGRIMSMPSSRLIYLSRIFENGLISFASAADQSRRIQKKTKDEQGFDLLAIDKSHPYFWAIWPRWPPQTHQLTSCHLAVGLSSYLKLHCGGISKKKCRSRKFSIRFL